VRSVSNIIGIIIGLIFVLLGLVLLVFWWAMFIKALMAIVPLLLILIGAGALAYFISEMKSKQEIIEKRNPSPEEKKPE
jgi:uncharacterized membrane protein YesL